MDVRRKKQVPRVEWLDPDCNIHLRLTEEVDLDLLLMELAMEDPYDEDPPMHFEDDAPTKISGAWGEVVVGRWRKQPCACGEYHRYDVVPVALDQNQRGSYLGVMG
jgi:hypothetical protein